MAFSKTGNAPIETVLCSCGGEIDKETKVCKKCGKKWEGQADGSQATKHCFDHGK